MRVPRSSMLRLPLKKSTTTPWFVALAMHLLISVKDLPSTNNTTTNNYNMNNNRLQLHSTTSDFKSPVAPNKNTTHKKKPSSISDAPAKSTPRPSFHSTTLYDFPSPPPPVTLLYLTHVPPPPKGSRTGSPRTVGRSVRHLPTSHRVEPQPRWRSPRLWQHSLSPRRKCCRRKLLSVRRSIHHSVSSLSLSLSRVSHLALTQQQQQNGHSLS